MEISYLGHSSFKIKTKQGTVITDPYDKSVGFAFPSVTGDIVTSSHAHPDHNNMSAVKPSAGRDAPFLISAAGEYEVSGISIFGFPSFHDAVQGKERGPNIVYSIAAEGITVVHLGDLGHELTDEFIEDLGEVDVLLCPVGGVYTIDAKTAIEVIQAIDPYYVIPMHYKTAAHDASTYGSLQTVEDFVKAYGVTSEPVKSLSVSSTKPEQTTLVVLES